MNKEKLAGYHCPIEAAMDIVGGKYKTIIIWNLIDATLRYNELQKAVPHATPRMLCRQLKELEADGIINRVLYPVVPPKTEYSLTELGCTLVPIIKELRKWSEDYYRLLGLELPPCTNSKSKEGHNNV